MENKRLLSIDRFRGFIVFCMCFFICAADFPCLGFLSRIANNGANNIMLFKGMSLADLIDPMFIFLISLSFQSSFNRRYEKEGNKAYKHFLLRYLLFMGIGSIIVSGEYFFTHNGKDPYLILTILMIISFLLFIANIIIKKLKKISDKTKETISKLLKICLISLGIINIILAIRDNIIIFGGYDKEVYKHWSIFSEIGFTGLLGILFLKFKLKDKIISWFILLFLYTLFQMQPGVIDCFDVVVLGGMIGTFGWLIILLGGIILMEFFRNKKYISYLIFVILLFILAFISLSYLPINSDTVTSNYLLFSLLIAAIIFGLLNLFNDKETKFNFFVWWGKNPLPLFGIDLIFRLIEIMWNPSVNTSLLVACIYTFGTTIFLSIIAYYLYKKNIIIKL